MFAEKYKEIILYVCHTLEMDLCRMYHIFILNTLEAKFGRQC